MSEFPTEATPLAPPIRCRHTYYVQVDVIASPSTQVQAGMRVQLTGTALGIEVLVDCDTNETSVPFQWLLFFRPPGGNENNITSSLQSASTLNPFFIANSEGTYRATLRAGKEPFGTKTAEVVITASPGPFHVSGHVTSILAHDVGADSSNDLTDVEVIVQLDTQPGKSFGFQLRNDKNRPARQGMFDLLRDAFNNNSTVTLDGSTVPVTDNGLIIQATLTK